MKSFATHFQSGTISSNETDGYGNSDTHFITGNAIIDFRDTFTIQARSFVIFDFFPAVTPGSDSTFAIRVLGKIYAVGTSSVYFTFNPEYTSPENGGKGFQLADTNTMLNSLLKYCILEYARNTDRRGGGAISIVTMGGTNTVTISGGTMYDNRAYDSTYGKGGGIFAYRSAGTLNLTIHSVKIQNNTAANNGGGIHLYGFTNPNGNPIYNCLITGNTADANGGGIYMETSNPQILNCTIADNEACATPYCSSYAGGGIYAYSNTSTPIIKNTIVYDNSPDQVDWNGADADATSIMYTYCNIGDFTGLPANFNIDSPPLWVDGYHLKYGLVSPFIQSPCINTGVNYSPNPPTSTDLDGNARVADGTIDMGCYENDGTNSNWWIVFNDINEIENITFKVNAYPNPVNDLLNLDITSENDSKINIQLINSVGKTVYENSMYIGKGENKISIVMQQFTTGFYFLKIFGSSQNSKIMKVLLK